MQKIQDIIQYIASYDSLGQSSEKIDTQKEFDLLGEYLNGNINKIVEKSSKKLSLKPSDLTSNDISVLNQILQNLKDKFGKWKNSFRNDTKTNIKNLLIDSDYVIDKNNKYELISMYDYIKENPSFLPEEDMNKVKDIIKNVIVNYIKLYDENINTDNIDEYDLIYCMSTAADIHKKLDEMEKCGKKVQDAVNKPYDNRILQETLNNYIKENNIPKLNNIPDVIDIGNGKFDRVSTQKTNNCWIHAGINSLLSTDTGTGLITCNYFRDEHTGMIAVHLQEAEDLGLHGGIFIISPQEIIDSQETLASGEGEISAYIISVKKYFEEVNLNPAIKEKAVNKNFDSIEKGNYGVRFYEIITGGSYTKFDQYVDIETKTYSGIGTSNNFDVNELYQMVENKTGAITISLRDAEHAISIICVKNGSFLIQESNNLPDFFINHVGENHEKLFIPSEPVNGRPTFELSKKDLEKYDLGSISYIKWE